MGLLPFVVNLPIKAELMDKSYLGLDGHQDLGALECSDWEPYLESYDRPGILAKLDFLASSNDNTAQTLSKKMRAKLFCEAIDVKFMKASLLKCLIRHYERNNQEWRIGSMRSEIKADIDWMENVQKRESLKGKCKADADAPKSQSDDQDCKEQLREKFTVVSEFEGLPSLEKDVQGNMQAVIAMQEAMVEIFHSARNKNHEMKNLGMILYGPPGTGKTFLAKAFARDLQTLTTSLRLRPVTFVQVTPAQVRNKYVGESEKSIETLFKCARALAPTVLFFDEGDAIFGGKDDSSGTNSNSRAELLQQLQGLTTGGELLIPIVATNYLDDIDQAARSRLPRHIYIPLPSRSALENLLTHYVSRQKVTLPDSSEDTILLPAAWKKVNNPSCLTLLADKLEGYAGRDVMTLVQQVAQTLQSKINQVSGMKLGRGFLDWLQHDLGKRVRPKQTPTLEANRAMWDEAMRRVKASTKEQERQRYEELVYKYSPDMAAAEKQLKNQDRKEKTRFTKSWEHCS